MARTKLIKAVIKVGATIGKGIGGLVGKKIRSRKAKRKLEKQKNELLLRKKLIELKRTRAFQEAKKKKDQQQKMILGLGIPAALAAFLL